MSTAVPTLDDLAALAALPSRDVWRFFLGLSRIPRPSKQEAAAAEWVAEQGRALGGTVTRDAVGNVLICKPATPDRADRPAVALQCHVDMVCEKNEGTVHDFTRDPIRVWRDGDRLRATGTTLGADNGIGVATALAVLADETLSRPAVEVLVTLDEETGLTGAAHLAPGWLTAPRLINLDSEAEGEVTIGCAGGVDTVARRRLTRVAPPAAAGTYRLKVHGLKGGHSGIDIDQGRGNALRVLAQTLSPLLGKPGLALASLSGGNKRNAIPREAAALLYADEAAAAALREAADAATTTWRTAFGAFDPGVTVTLAEADGAGFPAGGAVTGADADALVGLLLAGPHGVEAMSPAIRDLVQTSTNLGVVEIGPDDTAVVCFLTRSAVETSKTALATRVEAIAAFLGFTCEHTTGYPGWKPEPDSAIVRHICAVHATHFGRPIAIKAIHAGLECGLIGEKYPHMEMASIGPDMGDVHTPDEWVSISSVDRFWGFVRVVLAGL